MTIAQTSEQIPPAEEELEGYIPPPTDLIFDDGEPLESNRHRIAMNLLIRSLKHAWSQRNDFYTGGNMFIYYSSNQARNQNFRGPDFFVVLDTDGTRERQGWVVWEEDGRYPDVIVELMSKSTANQDTGPKKDIYERIFHTSDYFVYHPFQPQSLQGWHLNAQQQYQPLQPNEQGRLWCEKLGLWLGIWEATLERETAPWLRFFDPQGNLILLPEEAAQQEAQQAQLEAQQAQQEAQQAQQEAQQAQQEAQQAQLEAQQAQLEAQRAEQEAQQAQQRAAELEALLNLYKQQFGELPE